jgi:hypothetical protein
MAYSAIDKFTQPDDGIVILAAGPSNEELIEAARRIAQGEAPEKVYADIDGRVEKRNRERREAEAAKVGNQI